MKSEFHISLTGHRPQKLGGFPGNHNYNERGYLDLQSDLESFILRALDQYDRVICHSGLALGGDTIWSKAILSVRERYPDRVEFHAEVPNRLQSNRWISQESKDFWNYQLEVADNVTFYNDVDANATLTTGEMARDMELRNRGMLDKADVLLALHDGTDGTGGGTGNAVRYAKQTNLHTIVVHPSVYFG